MARPFVVLRVEWVKPVMAVKICPLVKSDFEFREGQYLYLNSPYISDYEWHPFTISSARGDLSIPGRGSAMSQMRVSLTTGEEVVPVPRPKGLDPRFKWNKFVPISREYKNMEEWEFLEKHETAYMDYVSCHIKVHDLNAAVPRTWTRKLKLLFESMSATPFPYHYTRRDDRGDVQLGRILGPDGKKPLLRVDGPHSAPTEHYVNYKTVMVVGAGIGMTPCASVLSAQLKYRWKYGLPPEKLHFYWIVQHGEIDAFQWFIHLMADLEHEHLKQRTRGNAKDWNARYIEINLYITRAPKDKVTPDPMLWNNKTMNLNDDIKPQFSAEDLYLAMKNPTVSSKKQTEMQTNPVGAENRVGGSNTWVWNGRPDWNSIFKHLRDVAVDPAIGCCFCGGE